jgi:hypothetical protein
MVSSFSETVVVDDETGVGVSVLSGPAAVIEDFVSRLHASVQDVTSDGGQVADSLLRLFSEDTPGSDLVVRLFDKPLPGADVIHTVSRVTVPDGQSLIYARSQDMAFLARRLDLAMGGVPPTAVLLLRWAGRCPHYNLIGSCTIPPCTTA